jgi:hypothetical protein
MVRNWLIIYSSGTRKKKFENRCTRQLPTAAGISYTVYVYFSARLKCHVYFYVTFKLINIMYVIWFFIRFYFSISVDWNIVLKLFLLPKKYFVVHWKKKKKTERKKFNKSCYYAMFDVNYVKDGKHTAYNFDLLKNRTFMVHFIF